jgi:hypothetical protein
MIPKYIYAGPSWAARSYDTIEGTELDFTNLSMEWKISFHDISARGCNNCASITRIKDYRGSLPIIMVLAEPLMDIDINRSKCDSAACEEFLQCDDVEGYRRILMHDTLTQLNQLGRPVGLIGGHTDITDTQVLGFDNLTIIDSSWQQFLSDHSIQQPITGWGVDVAHRIFRNILFVNSKVSDAVLNAMDTQFAIWDALAKYHTPLFLGVHPNRKGTELYAAYLKDKVAIFITTNTKETQ